MRELLLQVRSRSLAYGRAMPVESPRDPALPSPGQRAETEATQGGHSKLFAAAAAAEQAASVRRFDLEASTQSTASEALVLRSRIDRMQQEVRRLC